MKSNNHSQVLKVKKRREILCNILMNLMIAALARKVRKEVVRRRILDCHYL